MVLKGSRALYLFLTVLFMAALLSLSGCAKQTQPDAPESGRPSDETIELSPPPADTEESPSPEDAGSADGRVIAPIGSETFNNGGTQVQYGDSVYFYDRNDDTTADSPSYAIYVMRTSGVKREKLVATDIRNQPLYVFDGYLYLPVSESGRWTTYRIRLSDGHRERLADGRLADVDLTAGWLYCEESLEDFSTVLYRYAPDGGGRKEIVRGDYTFLARDGDALYFKGHLGHNAVLYASKPDGSGFTELAVIPVIDNEEIGDGIEDVIQFEICGDWIVLSVGRYEGSGGFFYGGLVRIRKDGGGLARFLTTEADRFFATGEYIYYNAWVEENDEYGCYRMRPDLTVKAFLGDEINSLLAVDGDDLYYAHHTDERLGNGTLISDLRLCKPDLSDVTTLFFGDALPQFGHSDFIGYEDISVAGDDVYFTARVHGNSDTDGWRGHDIYSAQYRVRRDGSGLTLLRETYHEQEE